MLKKFKKKDKYARKSVARDIEQGMKEDYERALRNKRSERVKKFQRRYV